MTTKQIDYCIEHARTLNFRAFVFLEKLSALTIFIELFGYYDAIHKHKYGLIFFIQSVSINKNTGLFS